MTECNTICCVLSCQLDNGFQPWPLSVCVCVGQACTITMLHSSSWQQIALNIYFNSWASSYWMSLDFCCVQSHCYSPSAHSISAAVYTPQLAMGAWQVQPSSVQNPILNGCWGWLALPCTLEPGAEFPCWLQVHLYQWSTLHTASH